jgi:hypothetical protein
MRRNRWPTWSDVRILIDARKREVRFSLVQGDGEGQLRGDSLSGFVA